MACFLAPAAAAAVTTAIGKKIPAKYHIEWLNAMLWGGVVMLAVDHYLNGEIIPYFPFLSALQNPADIPVMLKELVIVGGAMTMAIFGVWLFLVFFLNSMAKLRKTT